MTMAGRQLGSERERERIRFVEFPVSKKIQMICASGDGGDDVIIIHNQKGKRDLH